MEDEIKEEKNEKSETIGEEALEDDLEVEADVENLPI